MAMNSGYPCINEELTYNQHDMAKAGLCKTHDTTVPCCDMCYDTEGENRVRRSMVQREERSRKTRYIYSDPW